VSNDNSGDGTVGGGGGDGLIVDLAAQRGKRKGGAPRSAPPQPHKTKQSKAVPLCRHWLQVVNGQSDHALEAGRFHAWEPEPGKRVVLLEEAGEVRVVTTAALENAVLRHSERHYGVHDYALTPVTAREVVKYWVATATPVPEPAGVLWADEAGLTFRRLPWAFMVPDGPSPTWDALLGRIRNRDALVQWLGSLFAVGARNHQYAFLYGEGADGKGAINRFLAKVFGGSYCSKQPPASHAGSYDKFWTYELVGKRLVAFPDCNNTSFMASGLFKSLVGGDPLAAEAKREQGFTFTPRCKCIIFSNEKPKISSELADMRRIIYCAFETRGEYSPDFEERLWAEGGNFLRRAIMAYRAACPDHRDIVSDDGDIRDWVDEAEADWQGVFESLFTVVPAALPGDVAHRTATLMNSISVPAFNFQVAIDKKFRSRRERLDFTSWLEKRHKICRTAVRVSDPVAGNDGVRVARLYLGLQLKRQADGVPGLV
jgi:hypothetical protein